MRELFQNEPEVCMHVQKSNKKVVTIVICLFTFVFSLNFKTNHSKFYLESDISLTEATETTLITPDFKDGDFSTSPAQLNTIKVRILRIG